MRIFGRNANQQPTKANVPPELKPYFNGKPIWQRLGQLLPLAVAVVLAGAIIGGAVWVRMHRASSTQPATSQHAQEQTNTSQPSQHSQTANDTQDPQTSSAHTATPSNDQLLNTGPGYVQFWAAAGIVALGSTAFHIYQRRRLTS